MRIAMPQFAAQKLHQQIELPWTDSEVQQKMLVRSGPKSSEGERKVYFAAVQDPSSRANLSTSTVPIG